MQKVLMDRRLKLIESGYQAKKQKEYHAEMVSHWTDIQSQIDGALAEVNSLLDIVNKVIAEKGVDGDGNS